MAESDNAAKEEPSKSWMDVQLQFLGRLERLAGVRRECSREAAQAVAELWTEWRRGLVQIHLRDDLYWLITRLRQHAEYLIVAAWPFADIACTLAEAHRWAGLEEEFRAFLDAAMAVPATQVPHSTKRRLDAIKDADVPGKIRPLTDAELVFLEVLPRRTLEDVATAAGPTYGTVRHLSKGLKDLGLVEADRKRGWRRTPAGADALRSAGRSVNDT